MKPKAHATETEGALGADGCPAPVERQTGPGDENTPTAVGAVFLVLLIVLAIATVIILAWIGPVASGDSANAILAG